MVFGTARRNGVDEVGAFPSAVSAMCTRLREGVDYFPHSGSAPERQDGNLDVVVWKHFSDGKLGKLIGFGQCKTGTHWKNGLFEMMPSGFCHKWVRTLPIVEPVRLFFMTSRVRHTEWYDCSVDGGILFDRCRILDYAPKMAHLRDRWLTWTRAAIASQGIRRNMRHRLHALCPYFAMFPESFAETWIDQLSKPGEIVLDPFSGRGTTAFQSMLMGRQADRLRRQRRGLLRYPGEDTGSRPLCAQAAADTP